MEKKCKKAKWLSGEALQIAVKKREVCLEMPSWEGSCEPGTHLYSPWLETGQETRYWAFEKCCKHTCSGNNVLDLFYILVCSLAETFCNVWNPHYSR